MYLAKPETASFGGVLVLHSWWGLNDFFCGLCDRLAEEGFVALAPDLYDGRVATGVAEAKALRAGAGASRKEPAYRYLIRMIGELQQEAPGDVGLLGFSMGGHWAYWLAQRPELPVAATVSFYAARGGDYSKSRSAFLGHFAETDEWVSAASVKGLERALKRAGREHRFHTYAGTGHWFFESDRQDAYVPAAADLAWDRTLSFLRERRSGQHGHRAERHMVDGLEMPCAVAHLQTVRRRSPRQGVAVAEEKTRPTDASVDAYIDAISDTTRQSDCRALVAMLTKITKKPPVMWGPSIVGFDKYHYKYASGREGESCLLGFSSRKSDLTIYVTSGFEGTESILAELGKHKTTKACLYVKKLSDIDLDALRRLLTHAATEMKRRYP